MATNTSSTSIRIANSADAQAISDLIIPQTRKFVLPSCGVQVHAMLLDSMSPVSVSGYLNGDYRYHLAVNDSGELLGVVGMRENRHLYHLFVREDAAGQGLARRLWDVARKVCLDKGNEGKFTVNSAVTAENVYLKFGFKRIDGVREREGMVDIPMSLTL